MPITNDGIGGVEYLKNGIDELIRLNDQIVQKFKSWTIVDQTRGSLVTAVICCILYTHANKVHEIVHRYSGVQV